MMIWSRVLLAAAGVSLCAAAAAAELRTRLGLDPVAPDAASIGFAPAPDMPAALEPFSGMLVFDETRLAVTPGVFRADLVPGRDPQIFPALRLSFTTVGGDLLPSTQDVIHSGSTPEGSSAWDIRVQPGLVWSDPADAGWSRASFPFSLVAAKGGETLAGRATFRYRGHEVGELRYEIVLPQGGEATGVAATGVLTPRLEIEAAAAPRN